MRPLAIALLTIIGTCYAARLDNIYLPPGSAESSGGPGLIHPPGPRGGPIKYSGPVDSHGPSGPSGPGGLNSLGRGGLGGPSEYGGPSGFGPSSGGGAYQSSRLEGGEPGGQEIPIISYRSENAGDGNYEFSYETGNGISVQETGHQQGESESVSGSFSYTGPDGVQYSITYTADENGFHPQGAHLPTPPPIPPEIQRGVELALAAEARGENQDGGNEGYPQRGDDGYHNGGGGHGSRVSDAYQGPNSYQTSSGGGYQY